MLRGVVLAAAVVALAGGSAKALTTTTGCTKATSCTMAELIAGGSITVDGLLISNMRRDDGGFRTVPGGGTPASHPSGYFDTVVVSASLISTGFAFLGDLTTEGLPVDAGFSHDLAAPAGFEIVANRFGVLYNVVGEAVAVEEVFDQNDALLATRCTGATIFSSSSFAGSHPCDDGDGQNAVASVALPASTSLTIRTTIAGDSGSGNNVVSSMDQTFTMQAVPLPAGLALILSGLGTLLVVRRAGGAA